MITSTSNPHIKAIRKLPERKERENTGLFLAEGLRVVGQAFDSDAEIVELIVSPEFLISEFGRQLVQNCLDDPQNDIQLTEVSPEVFVSIARKDKPQGIAAVIAQKWTSLTQFTGLSEGTIVALEAVQNPGNLGTILRTCDAVGVKALLLLDNSTDPYDPAAVKASMGSIFTIPIIRANFEDLESFLSKNPHVEAIGTSDKATSDYYEFAYPNPILLMMGSEREGLSENYAQLCQSLISIPMLGACDSLNLSVATGILLYQIYQSHKMRHK